MAAQVYCYVYQKGWEKTSIASVYDGDSGHKAEAVFWKHAQYLPINRSIIITEWIATPEHFLVGGDRERRAFPRVQFICNTAVLQARFQLNVLPFFL